MQAGKAHESRSPLRERQMVPGSLWIADLGYFALQWLGQLSRQGGFFLLRYLDGTPIWSRAGKALELLDILPQAVGAELDLPLILGARQQVQVRLLAIRLPAEVIEKRRERMQERAREIGKTISARAWGAGPMDDHGHQCAGAQALRAGSTRLATREVAN